LKLLFLIPALFITLVFAYPQQKQHGNNYPGFKINERSAIKKSSVTNAADSTLFSEGFDGMWLPEGWTRINFHPSKNWEQSNPADTNLYFDKIDPHSLYSAVVDWAEEDQDEWLISPEIIIKDLPATLQWYAGVSGPWLADATLRCLISTDNGLSWKTLWNAVDKIESTSEWKWNYVETSLNEYGNIPLYIAWNYFGKDGDLAGIDGISLKLGNKKIFFSDFEDYKNDDFLVLNDTSGHWSTWNNEPGGKEDAYVVDKQASSPTKSVEVKDSSNLVLKYGEKTSGIYRIAFKYYVPNGNSAFFNVQHFEQAGIEDAFSVVFDTLGKGHINAGIQNAFSFNYPYDSWFTLTSLIDLDNDVSEFYIDNNLIYSWPFHYQSHSQTGTLQLGSINFRTFDPQYEKSDFYLDDIDIVEIRAGSLYPKIYISDSTYSVVLSENDSSSKMLRIGNIGLSDLNYQIVTTYPKPDKSFGFKNKLTNKTAGNQLNQQHISITSNNNSTLNPVFDDTILNYDGENASALGDTSKDYEWQIAAKFPSEMIKSFTGMEIYQVNIYINDLPEECTIQLFKMGPMVSGQPGELGYEQSFTPEAYSWNTVTLNSPFYLDGEDIWIGCRLKGKKGDLIPGVDSGPANFDGDWISFGNGWGHLSDSLSQNVNWNIRAFLNQEPISQWLSINSTAGTLKEYGYTDLDCRVNGSGLQEGNYISEMIIRSNDPDCAENRVKFYLDVVSGVAENSGNTKVLVYPNPARNIIFIRSDSKINEVRLFNMVGKTMFRQFSMNSFETKINTQSFSKGFYLVQMRMGNRMTTTKIVIE